MQPRHRARQHASSARFEPAALHQLVTVPKPGDELRQLAEVVAVVRVSHDHEPAARGSDASHERGAVALVGDEHDPRAGGTGDRDRVIGAAVVGDDDLADDTGGVHREARLLNARGQRIRLVEARHDHRYFDAVACSLVQDRRARGPRVVSRRSVRGRLEGVQHRGDSAMTVQHESHGPGAHPVTPTAVRGALRDPPRGSRFQL